MLSLVSSEIVPVTKALAKRFRDMEPLKNERALKRSRAQEHLILVHRQAFFTPLWGCCEYRGTTFRGNGNHTSRVLLCCMQAHSKEGLDDKSLEFFNTHLKGTVGGIAFQSPEDLPEVKEKSIDACVETFSASNDDDVVSFFRRYDSASSVRSQADVLGVYIGEQESLADLSRERVRFALNGVLPAAKREPQSFGLSTSESEMLARFRGPTTGASLRLQPIVKAVRWIVESVPDSNLYKNAIGAQVCAEVYATYGEELGEKIISEMINEIEADVDPAAAFEAALNKRHNKPTPETILKKGRTAVREIAKNLTSATA